MELIQVLMSTYNGEKYLQHQLNTIFEQKFVNALCLVRDDGSLDKTINILKENKYKNKNFNFYFGKNIGTTHSLYHFIEEFHKFNSFGININKKIAFKRIGIYAIDKKEKIEWLLLWKYLF